MNRIEVTHQFDPVGGINLNWQTAIGWTDQVEYSDDLVTWFADLPGSTFENLASPLASLSPTLRIRRSLPLLPSKADKNSLGRITTQFSDRIG